MCEIAKGQIISKGLLVLSNPPKKRMIEFVFTGKSLSEALILALTNPPYDDRLFIELPVEYIRIPSSEHGLFWLSKQKQKTTICVHYMFWAWNFHVLNW